MADIYLRAEDGEGSALAVRLDGDLTPERRAHLARVLNTLEAWTRVWFEACEQNPLDEDDRG